MAEPAVDEQLCALAEQSSDGVAITDEEGTVVVWNRRFVEMTGIRADEAVGRPIWEVQWRVAPAERRTPEALEMGREMIQEYLRTGIAAHLMDASEQTFAHPDGTTRHQEGTLFSISTPRGFRLASITRDVTDRLNTGRALEAYSAQQATQLEIGRVAVSANSRDELFSETVSRVSVALGVDHCGIFELQADGETLWLVAGDGWEPGQIGRLTLSVAGAVASGLQLLPGDQASSTRRGDSECRAQLAELGVADGVGVVIGDSEQSFGTLAVLSTEPRQFADDEINFLHSVALVLSEGLRRLRIGDLLRESEALFRTMYESASVGISRVAPDFHIVDANQRLCDMLGFTRSELIGMTIWEITGPDDLPESRRQQERLKNGEVDSFQIEKLYLGKEGRSFWGLLDASAVRDEGGTLRYFLGNVVDISERKRAEGELRKLSVGVAQSPVAIIITNRSGVIEYVNSRFCEISGYSVGEAVGRKPNILKSGEQPDELYRVLWTTITSGGTWSGEFHNRRKNGTLYWEKATIGPITAENGEISHFIGFKEDITERKSLELQLLQSQRLEAIGRLAGGIAHDFNNLLTVINGYSAILLESMDQSDPKRQEIKQIMAAGERAGTLTHQLLAFSRRQVIQPAVVDLNEVIRDIAAMLRRVVGEHIELNTQLSPDLFPIRVDPGQMNQVIMNLAVNARDALPSGGQITIESSNFTIDDEYSARHMGAKPGDYCMLAVSDDGVGMDSGTRSHAFEPFFTTKVVGEGTGLGLSTVYGIVKQHDGYVWLYSEPGHGTTARIYLPRAADRSSGRTDRVHDEADTSGSETILVVEDDETVRSLTAGILERAGYAVYQASDGRDAQRVFHEADRRVDLLLTDVIMPGMGGKELADLLSDESPGLHVLFVSGYTDEAISRAGILREDVEFMSKPYRPADLLTRLRRILDHRS